MRSPLRILYVGTLRVGGTCRHRAEALAALGHEVATIDATPPPLRRPQRTWHRAKGRLFRLGLDRLGPVDLSPADATGANAAILTMAEQRRFDVLWLDKALTVEAETLRTVKRMRPELQIVGYSPDDMAGRHNQSRQFLEHLPCYDHFFTTKPVGVAELQALGCPRVHLAGNAFASHVHRPVAVSAADRERLGGAVGFIGIFERERAQTLRFLARNGIAVRVWGGGWRRVWRPGPNLVLEHRWLWGEDYALALCAFDINLGFLRRLNRDVITTRSIEIPACGGFMLAERTAMHQAHFEEGKEAEFFASPQELLEKVRYYLAHPAVRRRIAAAGRARCLEAGYSNEERIRAMLAIVMSAGDHVDRRAPSGSAHHVAQA